MTIVVRNVSHALAGVVAVDPRACFEIIDDPWNTTTTPVLLDVYPISFDMKPVGSNRRLVCDALSTHPKTLLCAVSAGVSTGRVGETSLPP